MIWIKERESESKTPRVAKKNKGNLMFLSKCVVCDSKKSRFIKEQEANGLLSNLGLKANLNKILLLWDVLF